MKELETLQDYLVGVCELSEKLVKRNPDKLKIIDSIAEVTINGIEYQVQVLLEPSEKDWVPYDKLTLRQVID